MGRKALFAIGAVALLVTLMHVGTRIIGRHMLIARCEKDHGVLEDHGVFGNSRCVFYR